MNEGFPCDFPELVQYLTQNPRVRVEHFVEGESGEETFLRADASGHLLFKRANGRVKHSPAGAPCGPGGYPVHLDFRPDGFDVTMFGKTVRYFYHA